MADLIIQNPSITPNVFEYDEAGRVSAISGYPLAGGGGGTIVKSDLMWKPSVESDGFVHWTLASSATTPAAAYISGAQGPAGPTGPQGEQGPTGEKGDTGDKGDDATPITATTTTIAGGTQVTISYTSGGDPLAQFNVLSGAQGAAGQNGENGTSIVLQSVTDVEGGKKVTLAWGDGEAFTSAFVIPSGAPGTNGQDGTDGVSPTVTTSEIEPTSEHPQGGTSVTITDKTGPNQFNVWNGINGQGATVNLFEGPGIQITENGTNYTIAVSADYSGAATAWVGNQHYLTSVPDTYALKTDIPTTVAQLTDSDNYYTINQTSAASELTTEFAKYALLANIPTKVTDLTDSANYVVTGNILTGTDNTLTGIKIGSTDYTVPTTDLSNYYTKSQTSAASELDAEFANKVDKPDTTQTSLNNKYLVYSTLSGAGAVTGWTDFNANVYSKRESDGRYMQKNTDSTLSGDGTTNHPLGIDSDNFYELDTAGNYLTSQTSNQKTLIGTTPALDNAVGKVIASADVWDTVSAKSTVTINTANNEIKVNNNANSAISATIYDVCNTSEPSLIPQRLIVGTSSGDFVTYVNGGKCNGQGTLFFWLESMQPWVPVNN